MQGKLYFYSKTRLISHLPPLNKEQIFFFSNYLPLQIWTLIICIHDISKTITARSFKLGQLIDDAE